MINKQLIKRLQAAIVDVKDFPTKGIIFRDLTPILADSKLYIDTIDEIYNQTKDFKFDCIISPESRGYWFGIPLAYKCNIPFIPARKPGKLPREVISQRYSLEYGVNSLEIHKGDIKPGSRVLIVDDLLATGGTVNAICEMVKRSNATVVGCCFCVGLGSLNGIKEIKENLNIPCICLLTY